MEEGNAPSSVLPINPIAPAIEKEAVAAEVRGASLTVNVLEQNMQRVPVQRRRSFDDFTQLDTIIADLHQNMNQMVNVVENVEIGFPRPSKSSIEMSIFLSSTFESIAPFLETLGQKVQEGLEIYRPPARPSTSLLQHTARKMSVLGDNSLVEKIQSNAQLVMSAGWDGLNTIFSVFHLNDRQIIGHLRRLQSQTPSSMPAFPDHLNASNTFVVFGTQGAYFFGEEFLCRVPRHEETLVNQNQTQREHQENDSDVNWNMASDTEDEAVNG